MGTLSRVSARTRGGESEDLRFEGFEISEGKNEMKCKIPDIALEYWGWTHPPAGIVPGMYGLDQRRADCHKELCKYYELSKAISKQVTDNLDKYETVADMHNALEKLIS
jgi:hypothetical protein